MTYKERYESWLNDTKILPEYKEELLSINDEKEIEDRFYRDLEFGTAGLRGVRGAGTNRMNEHTVGKAAEGLARYLKKKVGVAKIVIAYDSRIKSPEFALYSAKILAYHGHVAYLYDSLRPVPLLSFAVRYLNADSGIVITASHNPSEYNGFKVYGSYGGQVTDEDANSILEEMLAIEDLSEIKTMDQEEALKSGRIVMIGDDVDRHYYDSIKTLVIRKGLVKDHAKDLKILYTPLHGSGNVPVRKILGELGYNDVNVVPEQELPDGNFPTAPYPNPENPQVFELALKQNETLKADIIFGTDPDADRLGVIVLDKNGTPKVLTGNQTGMLLTDYMLSSLKEEGTLPKDAAIIKTIVTTESVRKIAAFYGATLYDVLTGFKYIGEKIEEFIKDDSGTFIFGFEESYGYSAGAFVRDKDAVVTSMMVCEMALFYKMKDMTLYDALIDVYDRFGYFNEGIRSYAKAGKDGAEMIKKSLDYFRALELLEINGVKVVKKQDFLLSTDTATDGTITPLTLPKSNVIKYMLEDDSWFVIRPSGTEPKMKAYAAVKGTSMEDSREKLGVFLSYVDSLVDTSFQA